MSEPTAPIVKRKGPGGRKPGSKSLTVAQKAEAIAMWRGGTCTLEDLSKRFKKRPETFSRLFSKMGIKKGDATEEMAKKMAAKVEAKVLSSVEEQLARIASVKDEYFKMESGIAKLAWGELVRARQAGLDIGSLKDVMSTLKLAGELIGNSRKELYTLLNVDESEKNKELEDLPELTVRELTQNEVIQLRDNKEDELSLDADPGADLLDDEEGA